MNRYILTILCSVLIIDSNPSFAQTFPHRFQTWNSSNGLSSVFCNKIAQDNKGYLFVATRDGVNKFNSYSFSLLAAPGKIISEEGNIDDIVIDDKSRVWFAGTASGLGLIDLKQIQDFKPVYLKVPFIDKNDPKISKLAFDKNGYLWVGSRGKGLFRTDTLSKKIIRWKLQNPNSEYSSYIRFLYLYKPDTLFVGIVNGLSIINPQTGSTNHVKFKHFKTGNPILPTIRKIIHWQQDTFVVATDRGAWFLDLKSGNLIEINTNKKGIQLSETDCNDVLRFTKDELWFATEKDGILYFNTLTHKHAYSYEMQIFDEGVPKGNISSFFRDKTGNIWIAHEYGISVYRLSFSKFLNYAHNNEYPNLSGVVISDSTNLVGIDGKYISKFDIQKGVTLRDSLKVIPGFKYPSFFMKHKEYGYITFCNTRFFRTDPRTLVIKEFKIKPINLSLDSIGHFRILYCLPVYLNQKESWLMIASVPSGSLLLLFDPVTKELNEISAPGLAQQDADIQYTKIIRDNAGDFWIGSTTKGLFISSHSSLANFVNFTATSVKCALPTNNISDLLQDGKSVWATLYGIGLIKIQKNSSDSVSYELYDKKYGLDNPYLFRMLPDDNDNIWITSSNGLVCFNKKNKRFYRFSLENGIRNTKFALVDTHIGKTSTGYVYFSDRTNMIAFIPVNIFNYSQDIQLILSRVESARAVYNTIYNNKLASFPYSDNTIAFSYDVLNYENEKGFEINYMLEGYDKKWSTTVDLSKIIYRHIPSGKYKFKMKLLMSDGKFASEQIFTFQITTPWYQTWWFISLFILAVTGIIYEMFRYRLQQKLRVFQVRNRLHRDLHDDVGATLSSVKAYSEILKDNPNNSVIAELIKDNSIDMLERLEIIAWATNPQNDYFKSLKSTMIKFAAPICHAKQIEFKIESNEINDEMLMPGEIRQNIFLVFKEAINNMIKYADSTTCATRLFLRSNQFVMQLIDNGKGFDGVIKGTGSGWKNMQNRTEGLKGKLTIDTLPEKGTTITLKIPYPFKIPNSWDPKRP